MDQGKGRAELKEKGYGNGWMRERSRDGRPLCDVREGGEKGKMGRG